MNFVVVDVETANPNFASICQIGIAPFRDGVPERPRQWLVNPQDYFDPIHVYIHGIDEYTVRDAPKWPEVYATVAPFLAGNIVASHRYEAKSYRSDWAPRLTELSGCMILLLTGAAGGAFASNGLRPINT